jgi:hypothetical protein
LHFLSICPIFAPRTITWNKDTKKYDLFCDTPVSRISLI